MSSGGNKKTTKNTPNKNYKWITIKKIEEMLEEKFKSCEENIKSYLANNMLLSKRINQLNGKPNNLQYRAFWRS